MDEEEIQRMIHEDGYIRVTVIFEVVGNPKEHVTDSLKSYLENIKTDDNIEVLDEEFAQPEEIEEGLWSSFVDTEMLVNGLKKLTWLCYNFTPASVEIIEPTNFQFKAPTLQNWINDLLSKLHEVGNVSKQVSSQNKLLVKNFNRLIKNSILMCIDFGVETPKGIEEKTGIPYEQLKPFFEALIKEGKIQLEDDQYERTD